MVPSFLKIYIDGAVREVVAGAIGKGTELGKRDRR